MIPANSVTQSTATITSHDVLTFIYAHSQLFSATMPASPTAAHSRGY